MQLIEAFVQNPVKVAVGVLLVALFGVIALLRMPMQLTPEVQIPTISIETRWPGASPEEVEREIIQEQEEQLQGVEGMTKLTAECSNSMGVLTLEFKVGTELSEALLKVNSRLQQVREYPEEADEPVISTASSSDSPIAWFILRPRVASPEEIEAFQAKHPELAEMLEPVRLAHGPGLATQRLRTLVEERPEMRDRIKELLPLEIDVSTRRRFAEDYIEARFERVPGVSNSNVYGGREEEMQVIVDPQRLAVRGLTIMNIRNALRQQNRDISAGDLWDGKRRYVIRTLGRFRTPEQVADVIVAEGADGAPVYLSDVAEVRLGYKKPDGLVKNFGTTCLAINCIRETGANVLDVMAGLREAREALNRDLLRQRGLQLIQVYDETDYIYSAVHLVNQNIVIGGLLTVGVLLLFLRSGRSTIVIALAIPTSIVGTFLMLNLMGRSLNVISLAGLAFAVGMLVDNAVVVLENVYRHYQLGDRPFAAAVRGTKEVWGAVMASTLTTLAVFLPVLFVEEEAGQLFRDIALAISSAVGLSLVVSITVIPPAAARILRRRGAKDHDEDLAGGVLREPSGGGRLLGSVDALGKRFVSHVVGVNRLLQRSFSLRLATVLGFVFAAVGLSWLLMPKVEYLPTGNRNLVFGMLLPPPGYNIRQLMELGTRLEEGTKPYWDISKGDPANEELDYPPIDDYFFVARGRMAFLGLRAVDPSRARELVELVQGLCYELPGVIAIVNQASLFGRNLTSGRTVDIEIAGPELPRLVELGTWIMSEPPKERPDIAGIAISKVVPGSRAVPVPGLDLSSPEVHVLRKSEQAADMGISTDELGYSVDALVDGAYATDYYVGSDKIDLTIVGNEQFAQRTQDVEGLVVATPSGQLSRLEGLAEVTLEGGPEQINHRERERAITIQVTPPTEVPLEEAMGAINQKIVRLLRDAGEIGGAYRINLAGTADKLRATWHALRWNFVLALLITYLLMAALFESWLYPFVIIFSVPLGAVGGVVGLWLLNAVLFWSTAGRVVQSLDVLTMLGFVILIGTVVNNAILIVHQSINHMRDEGMDPNDAILESVRTRIRPIFMTTSTTVLGLSPLVLFPGAGQELYRGLGAVVLGGLVVSTVFTLVLVPTLFSLMLETKAFLARWLGIEADTALDRQLEPATMASREHAAGVPESAISE